MKTCPPRQSKPFLFPAGEARTNLKDIIRIAIQSKGRLNEDSLALLRDIGIDVDAPKRKLVSRSQNFPLEALYLRDDDIPQVVAGGTATFGIVGLNEVEERAADVDIVARLGFGTCRLSLAIPKGEPDEGPAWFNGRKIATSYPGILRRYLDANGIDARIEVITGSVEIAPAVGIADAIFDIVSSGSTLIANGLKEVETAMESEAVLIARRASTPRSRNCSKTCCSGSGPRPSAKGRNTS